MSKSKKLSFTQRVKERKAKQNGGTQKQSAIKKIAGGERKKEERKHKFDVWQSRVERDMSPDMYDEMRRELRVVSWSDLKSLGAVHPIVLLPEHVLDRRELPDLSKPGTWLLDPREKRNWFANLARVYGQQRTNILPEQGPERELFPGMSKMDAYETLLKGIMASDISDRRKRIESQQKFSRCDYGGYQALHKTLVKQYSSPDFHGDKDLLTRAVNDVLNEIDWTDFAPLSIGSSISDVSEDAERSALSVLYENTQFATNSGWPYYIKSENLDEKEVRNHIKWAEMIVEGHPDAEMLKEAPSVLFRRVQMGRIINDGGNDIHEAKSRAVMGVPMFTKIAGGTFWYALFSRLREVERYQSYKGNHNLYNVVQKTLSCDYCVSLDFENYDTTVTHIFRALFDSLLDRFSHDTRITNVLRWERDYYFNCPLITPLGIVTGSHGLFSGAIGTSFGGSLCNAIACRYAELRIRERRPVNFAAHCTMGDDTILGISTLGELTLDEIIDPLEELGLKCSRDIDKQWFCTPKTPDDEFGVVFLSRYWHLDNIKPEFSLVRALGNIVYGESLTEEESFLKAARKKVRDMSNDEVLGPILMRIVSSMMNVEHHPQMVTFVRWIMQNSPHALAPQTWLGLTHLLRIYGAHIDHESVAKHGMEVHTVVKEIVTYYDRLVSRGETIVPSQNPELCNWGLEEIAAEADRLAQERKNKPGEMRKPTDSYLEAVMESDLSDSLKQDIINRYEGGKQRG